MRAESARRRPLSLALRITLVVSLTMAAVFGASAWLVSRSIEAHFADMDFGELQVVAASLAQALGDSPQRDDPGRLSERLAQAVAGHHGVHFAVFDAGGRTLYARAPAPLMALAATAPMASALEPAAVQVWRDGDEGFRGSVVSVARERVLVAVSTTNHERYLATLRRGLGWGALAATVLALVAVCIAVRWGHAPLRRVGEAVRGITSDQLHRRLDATEVPEELEPLVAAFNTMLDHLQQSFERLSHFSADIAHELRTPLTNLMTQTQVALSRERPAADYREALYTGLDQLDRLRRMVGDMLFLAQAEDPQCRLAHTSLTLDAELDTLFDYFEALAEESALTLRRERSGSRRTTVRADRDMLQRALGNLVGNALRHTARGGTVTVRVVDEAERLRIEVENPGAAIEPVHQRHLFDRFYRVDPARQRANEGAGLGLAIVKAIAEAHGGGVGVRSEGGVNTFWLALPAPRRESMHRSGAKP